MSRSQRSYESSQKFEHEINRMIQFARPEDPEGFRGQMAAQTFIDVNRDPEVQKTSRFNDFNKSTDAPVREVELEAVRSINKS